MFILNDLLASLKPVFPNTEKGQERSLWFSYTLLAILVPLTNARTSNLLRSLKTLFGLSISKRRYYTFMASPKLPWNTIWVQIWKCIPAPLTDGRLIAALDDSINSKTGKKIFACQHFFDHAAKDNQSQYPWSQNIVSIGLLKRARGRWCCLPLAFKFYFMQKTLKEITVRLGRKPVVFRTKFEQAVDMLSVVAKHFAGAPILVVTDSWFGNAGLFKPLRKTVGKRAHILSRLRVNATLYDLPPANPKKRYGRPRKYGSRLGSAQDRASRIRNKAKIYQIHMYGKMRDAVAYDQVVMLKTLKCPVRVVWVFRRQRWIALMTTDLGLSVEQIIEYYAARWKIESGFKEIKQEIGSASSQTRNPFAVTNHLHFCMLATTLTWIYAERLDKTPARRYASANRTEFAFADVRRTIANEIGKPNFSIVCHDLSITKHNSFLRTVMRLVA